MRLVAHTIMENLDDGADFRKCAPSNIISQVLSFVKLTAGYISFAGLILVIEPVGNIAPFKVKLSIGKSV